MDRNTGIYTQKRGQRGREREQSRAAGREELKWNSDASPEEKLIGRKPLSIGRGFAKRVASPPYTELLYPIFSVECIYTQSTLRLVSVIHPFSPRSCRDRRGFLCDASSCRTRLAGWPRVVVSQAAGTILRRALG
jgi:hypothetical protein